MTPTPGARVRLFDTGRRVHRIAYLPDARIAAASDEPRPEVGVLNAGAVWRTVARTGRVTSLAASPGGEWLAWSAHGALFIARPSGLDLEMISYKGGWDRLAACAFSPDGRSLLAVNGELNSWSVGDWRRTYLTDLAHTGPVDGLIAVGRDGTEVTTLNTTTGKDGNARLVRWRLGSPGAGRAHLAGDLVTCTDCPAASYSADGQFLAAICNGGVWVFAARTGAPVHASEPLPRRRFRLRRPQYTCLAFRPDSRRLALGAGTAVMMLDTASWGVVASYDWGVGRVGDIAFGPDGLTGAACGDSGRVAVFDVGD